MGLAEVLYDLTRLSSEDREAVKEDIRRAGLAIDLATRERINYTTARARIDAEEGQNPQGQVQQATQPTQAYDAQG